MAKILFIGKTLPLFDRASGDHRLWMLAKILARMHDVDFIACQHAIEELESKKIFYPIWDSPVNLERFRYLDDGYAEALANAGIELLNPLKRSGPAIRSHPQFDFRPLLQDRYDLIIVEFYYLAAACLPWLRELQPQAKVYVDSVDIHWRRHEQEIRDAQLGQRESAILASEAEREKKKEIFTYQQADGVITVSASDSHALHTLCPQIKPWWIPNIFPTFSTEKIKSDFSQRDSILFVGNFDHHPNRNALDYLIDKVAPLVLEKNPSIQFRIVGHNLPKDKMRLPANVELVGWVPNLANEWKRSRINIAPVFVSAGMNGKIGEAMRMGVPTITTSLAATNMGLSPGSNCLVANDPHDFSHRILSLWSNPTLWNELSSNGLDWLEKNLGEQYWEEKLESDISKILPAARGRQTPPSVGIHRDQTNLKAATFPICKKIDVSIIMLAHNQWEYTELALRSLGQSLAASDNVEVILVDNASNDSTRTAARFIPGLRLLRLEENLGFAGGMNAGARIAKGQHLVFLNNDIILPADWFKRMRNHAESIPDLGILGCLSNTEPDQQPARLEAEYYSGLDEFFSFAASISQSMNRRWHKTEKVSALLWWTTRDAWEKVGELDTGFGRGYFEDDDFCLRIQDAGLRLICADDVYVHHFGSVSFGALAEGREPYLDAGMQKFIFKWGKRALEHISRTHRASLLRPEIYLGHSRGKSKPSEWSASR